MLNFAVQTARDAGAILAERFGRQNRIMQKGEIDIVTEADLASERFIIDRIRSHYPRHAILSEEAGAVAQTGGDDGEWKWIIDPLDGTTNYSHYRLLRLHRA
ncbi:MAG: inositol monophosphatase family protein [Pyrinomonadaceae bacterium]